MHHKGDKDDDSDTYRTSSIACSLARSNYTEFTSTTYYY